MKKKVLIPDTSWLMEVGGLNYNSLVSILQKLPDAEFWIHYSVLKELDGLKNNEDKSFQARRAIKYIREAAEQFKNKIKISDFKIKRPVDKFASVLQSQTDAILITLLEFINKSQKLEGTLLTFDTGQEMVCAANKFQFGKVVKFSENIKYSRRSRIKSLLIWVLICCTLAIPLSQASMILGISTGTGLLVTIIPFLLSSEEKFEDVEPRFPFLKEKTTMEKIMEAFDPDLQDPKMRKYFEEKYSSNLEFSDPTSPYYESY